MVDTQVEGGEQSREYQRDGAPGEGEVEPNGARVRLKDQDQGSGLG